MASPPFSISTVTPGDSDIVSQFPLNERTVRDITQSWLLANHDVNGNHNNLVMPYETVPTVPAANLLKIFATATGKIQVLFPDGHLEYLGVPAGTVIFAGWTPNGYLIADGSAVSRSTFVDLFNALGTTFGSGNGSTTFNIPDLRGRIPAGEDLGAGVLTSTWFGGNPATIGLPGGAQNHTLLAAEIPAITSSGNNNISVLSTRFLVGTAAATALQDFNPQTASGFRAPNNSATIIQETSAGVNAIGVTSNNAGGGAHSIIQPTLILRALIKT